MIVMMSSIAVMFRKVMSGSPEFRRIAFLNCALYVEAGAAGTLTAAPSGSTPEDSADLPVPFESLIVAP